MSKKPTVAVVIPFYNGARWIERALASVREQTVAADEFIVVNDGSCAEEQSALYALQAEFDFRIIDKPNGGQGSARNAGVESATSEYICFLDQDDFYLPEHIELLVRGIPHRDSRFGWVYGDAMEADGDGNIMRTSMVKEHNPNHPKRSAIEMIQNDMFVLPSASLISRKAFLSIGGFDPRFTGYEDDDFFLRLFRNGYTNYFIDLPVYVWCIHSESTSYTVRMSRSRFLYFTKLVSMFPDEKDKARFYFRDCLIRRFGRSFIADAVKAADLRSEHRKEIIHILLSYASIVYQNPYVGLRYKTKLRLITLLLRILPCGAMGAFYALSRLPIARRLKV